MDPATLVDALGSVGLAAVVYWRLARMEQTLVALTSGLAVLLDRINREAPHE